MITALIHFAITSALVFVGMLYGIKETKKAYHIPKGLFPDEVKTDGDDNA